jgi:hypothetical protein
MRSRKVILLLLLLISIHFCLFCERDVSDHQTAIFYLSHVQGLTFMVIELFVAGTKLWYNLPDYIFACYRVNFYFKKKELKAFLSVNVPFSLYYYFMLLSF